MGEVVIQVVYLDFAGARSWTPVQSFLRPKLAGAGNITYQNVPAHFTAVYSKSNGYLGSENTVQLGHWAVALKGFFPSYKKARICYYFMIGGCPTSETLTDPVNKGDVVLRPLLSFTWPMGPQSPGCAPMYIQTTVKRSSAIYQGLIPFILSNTWGPRGWTPTDHNMMAHDSNLPSVCKTEKPLHPLEQYKGKHVIG